jgi:hypothetical protein
VVHVTCHTHGEMGPTYRREWADQHMESLSFVSDLYSAMSSVS